MYSTILYLESCILPSHTLNFMIQRKTFKLAAVRGHEYNLYWVTTRYMPSRNCAYIVRVTELNSFQNLPHDFFHIAFISPSGVLLKVIKCSVVHKLKHKVEALFASKHFNQIHQVFMAKLL